MNELPKDRKGRQIEVDDYVAFDYLIVMGDEGQDEMWDILWGMASEEGINVLVDPISGRQNQIYNYSEASADMLIIKKKDVSLEEFGKKFKTKNAEEVLVDQGEVMTADQLGMSADEVQHFMDLEKKSNE